MAKKLIIETQVNTESIDKAVAKLGQIKDLGRGLKIQYDIDGKPLDVVIDKSLNLQKQVKILTAELRRTKEGTAEFSLLSSKLGDAQDQLAKTTAKSKDLFSSLSMIPGPVGQFFGQLQGGIELLKTFSSFTFKDLSFQFKETANDIADIGKNLTGVEDATKPIDNVNDSAKGLKNTLEETAATSASVSTSLNTTYSKLDNLFVSGGKRIEAAINQNKAIIAKLQEQLKDTGAQFRIFEGQAQVKLPSKEFENLSKAQYDAIVSGGKLAVVENQLIVASQGATFWTKALGTAIKTTLISLGITAAIVIIGELVAMLYKFVSGTEDAEAATRSLTSALEEQQRVLQNDLDAIDMANKANVTRAKIAGKSEEEITRIIVQGGEERLKALRDYDEQLFQDQRNLTKNTKISAEDRAKLSKDINDKILKNGQDITKQILGNEQLRLDEQLRIVEKKRQALLKSNKTAVLDTKAANDLLLKLQQENSVNLLNEERKRQDAQLIIDKKNEEREIGKLFELEGKKVKLTKEQEELKSKLLEQVKYKYGLKVIELNKKRQAEDNKTFDEEQKKVKEYQDKIFEIFNQADTNELSRNKAARAKKFEDDKQALQNDANFQKQSLEDKIRILLTLEKAFNQDIQKLDDDDAQKTRDKNLKRLDDELRLLDIKNKALIEGTKRFFDNQRAILEAANKKELADLEDRAIKEKLTAEQIKNEKEAINKAYLASLKDISNKELQVILQAAQATLGVAQTIASDVAKVAQLGQQVALEQATKRYIEQNELDKKTITNQQQLEAKLLENKKKFAKEEDEIKRKAFEENKKIQIAQAVIATLQSAVGAYSSLIAVPIVGPVIAPIAAAAALIFGYKQVDLIKKTQYQSPLALSESESSGGAASKPNYGRNYAKGGMIGGRRHAEGGTLIEAEKGEAIMTRGAVASFGPLLSLMNQAGGGTSFNSNLTTTRQDNPIINNPTQEQSPLIVKTYVVSQELTTEAQRQARLKNLSTI